MENQDRVQIALSCCAAIFFNLETGHVRYYAGSEFKALKREIGNMLRAKARQAGLPEGETLPEHREVVATYMEALLANAPSTPQVVCNQLLAELGLPTIRLEDLPVKLTSHEMEFDFLHSLLSQINNLHQQAGRQAFARAMEQAVQAQMGESLSDAMAEGNAPMLVIPLDADGNPNMQDLLNYAPGTEAYETIRAQVEPNRVPGNKTIH